MATAPFTLSPRSPRRSARAFRDLAGGALLLAVWVSLWTFFTLGVAAPAGRIAAGAAGAAPSVAAALAGR
jgi:hypothetical protein